jgi:hypothetical protein
MSRTAATVSRASAIWPTMGMTPTTTCPPVLLHDWFSLKSPTMAPSKNEPTPSSLCVSATGCGAVVMVVVRGVALVV